MAKRTRPPSHKRLPLGLPSQALVCSQMTNRLALPTRLQVIIPPDHMTKDNKRVRGTGAAALCRHAHARCCGNQHPATLTARSLTAACCR
jgi:hypothetical protein